MNMGKKKGRAAALTPRDSGPITSQVFYLPVYFVQRLSDAGFQLCPSVVGQIARKGARRYQEHAHVA
jgi:hypothetical protein